MPQFLIDLFRKLKPGGQKLQIGNRFQRRALMPTWPVTLSLLVLGAGLLLTGQGQAIVRLAASSFEFSGAESYFNWTFLTLHGLFMMYTAFMLSAVTRRNYLDERESNDGPQLSDPVDPSIKLRLVYSYMCGVFLPLLFMAMALWFRHGWADPELWSGVGIGVAVAFVYVFLAQIVYPRASRSLGRLYLNRSGRRAWLDAIGRLFFRILRFVTQPGHRIAQSAIIILLTMMVVLTVLNDQDANAELKTYLLNGAWAFFASFLAIHTVFRLFTERFVRLHHGHVARYIVIDPKLAFCFRWARRAGIVLIPALFWNPVFVKGLGPLNVGLFGTLWITLLLSAMVESGSDRKRLPRPSFAKRGNIRVDIKARSWFLILVVGLFFVECLVRLGEWLRFGVELDRLWVIVALVGAVVAAFVLVRMFGKQLIGNRDSFVYRMNTLPTLLVLSPILALSFGEAHNVHRLILAPTTANQASTAATSPFGAAAGPNAPVTGEALDLNDHARQWVQARMGNGGSEQPVPAIVILAEGGGIRAAAHAGYYLSALDDKLRDVCSGAETAAPSSLCWREDTRLADNIFLISGVSGGAIGTATYLAALYEENNAPDAPPTMRGDLIHATLSADHLSSLLSGMFASDILTTVVPVQLPDRFMAVFDEETTERNTDYLTSMRPRRGMADRADIFETRLAREFETSRARNTRQPRRTAGQRTFDLPLETVSRGAVRNDLQAPDMAPRDPGPIVFYSTFSETAGQQMVAANVDITKDEASRSRSVDGLCGEVPVVQQMLGKTEQLGTNTPPTCTARTQTLPLSSAAHLSARFPVFNPTGVIETRDTRGRWQRHFFVDGGYMDNSGALAASQAIEALRQAAEDERAQVDVLVIQIYALSIPPVRKESELRAPGSAANRQSEFTSIPSAVLKARSASSTAPVLLLCERLFEGSNAAETCANVLSRKTPDPIAYGLTDGSSVTKFQDQFNSDAFNKRKEGGATITSGLPTAPESYCAISSTSRSDPEASADTEAPDPAAASDDTTQTAETTPGPIIDRTPGIASAHWLPMPLEIATNSRQQNAMVELLGWTLPEQMSDTIRWVAPGAAELTASELFRATGHSTVPAEQRCQPRDE